MDMPRFLFAMAVVLLGLVSQAQDANRTTKIATAEYSGEQKSLLESIAKEYSEKIKNDPDNLKSYETRATVNLALQQYELAIADYDLMISRKQDNASWYFFRGVCKLSLQKNDEACVDLKKAKELNYDFNSSELLMFCP